mmetsp:Transcript_9263/g.27402  ORF Transcript_9263/g.27402 Transcript_9263/m.27402 type:complete len:251 (-) Transcript_9263:193-945(-)
MRSSTVVRAFSRRDSNAGLGETQSDPSSSRLSMRVVRVEPSGLSNSASNASSLPGMSSADSMTPISCTLGMRGSHLAPPPLAFASSAHMVSMLSVAFRSTVRAVGVACVAGPSSSIIFTEKAVQHCRNMSTSSRTSTTKSLAVCSVDRACLEPSTKFSGPTILSRYTPTCLRVSLAICFVSCSYLFCTLDDAPTAPALSSCLEIFRMVWTESRSRLRRSSILSMSIISSVMVLPRANTLCSSELFLPLPA